jgi:hypothetical protein
MKAIFRFLFVIVVLTAMFGIAAARPANAASLTTSNSASQPADYVGCIVVDVNLPAGGIITFSFIQGHLYNFYVNGILFLSDVASYTATESASFPPGHYVFTDASASGCGGGEVPFKDGRLNNRDAGQSAAIYCENGGITIYGLYNSQGFIAFKTSKAEIARVSATPSVNTRIKSAKGITLWRLTSGEFEVSGPNGYTFIWTGDCSQ